MSENMFFEKKGPFPLIEITKIIGCSNNASIKNNPTIKGFESLDNATNNDITFLNSSKYQKLSLKTKASACITTSILSKLTNSFPCIKPITLSGLSFTNILRNFLDLYKRFYSCDNHVIFI